MEKLDPSITMLNAAIEEHTPDALDMLSGLANYCVFDESMRTPLETAIEYGNDAAVDMILESKAALEFVPPQDEALARRIKAISNEHFEDTAEKLEAFLERMVHEPFHWQRTPLLHACRQANLYALRRLIENGAKLTVKDVVGNTAPELCHLTGGDELTAKFFDVCEAACKKFPVNVALLNHILANPELTRRAVALGSVNATAKRKVFNLACAMLDIDTVRAMIESGHKINNSKIDNGTPLAEAATSRLLYLSAHPECTRLAGALQRAWGSGQELVMKGSDLEDLISKMEEMNEDELGDYLFGEGELDEPAMPDLEQTPRPDGTNPKYCDAQTLSRRCALIDLLVESGLDPNVYGPYELDDMLGDVIAINEPALLEKLTSVGVDFTRASDDGVIRLAIHLACYDMIAPLEALGFKCPKVNDHWRVAFAEYERWCAGDT